MTFGEGAPHQKKESERKPSRREFLAGAAAAIAVGAAGADAEARQSKAAPMPSKVLEKRPSQEELPRYIFLEAQKHAYTINAGELAGRNLAGLFALYAGNDPKKPIPAELEVDFKYRLAQLWRKKLGLPEEVKPTDVQFYKNNKTMLDLAEQLYRSYDPERLSRVPLAEYMREVEEHIQVARESVAERWDELENIRGLSKANIGMVRQFERQLSGKALLAYALTELMPSEDGKANAAMLDFLLQNAGAQFVESIPALGDTHISYGPYQITDMALVSRDKSSGSAKLNRQFGIPVPAKMSEMSGSLHHTTAYALALEAGIAAITRNKNVPEAALRDFVSNPENILTFVAVSHHRPADAQKWLRTYLDMRAKEMKRPEKKTSKFFKRVAAFAGIKEKRERKAPKRFIEAIGDPALATYARKTILNYNALQASQLAAAVK